LTTWQPKFNIRRLSNRFFRYRGLTRGLLEGAGVQRHFTFKQFRYFLAVSETGSVAGAARMINIAQSAVTAAITSWKTRWAPGCSSARPAAWCSRRPATGSSPVRAR
jgi:hypothetical protein